MFEEALGAVIVFLAEDVEDFVGEDAGQGSPEEEVGAAEITAPHGGADGSDDSVAQDNGKGWIWPSVTWAKARAGSPGSTGGRGAGSRAQRPLKVARTSWSS